MESKAQRIFLDVSEERGEPSGFFVRNDLKESIEKLEKEGKLKVVGIIYDETYTIELITKLIK
jgi:nitrogenase subunit NifH|tara:strand:+ start:489 stop:677 length:189 start_codon:yes stop_codon:yes gene_type:complete